MEQLYSLLRSVSIFFFLVIFILILRHRGIFNNTHLPVFGKLITELILPITIFSTLAVSKIDYSQLYGAGIYVTASLLVCAIAYLICRKLNYSDAITGSIVILAGFGSTSTIAYPIISQTFGAESQAMTSALIIGEFGSCIPFFSIGLLILAYFGSKAEKKDYHAITILRTFMSTPVFFSLIGGILISLVPPISSLMSTDFFNDFFAYFNNAFEILVAVTIGLMLKPVKIKDILPYLVITLPLSLILMPMLIFFGATLTAVPDITREVLLIEAAVPSGAIAAVMAERYGCDGTLSSMIVIVSFIVSLITLPALSILLL